MEEKSCHLARITQAYSRGYLKQEEPRGGAVRESQRSLLAARHVRRVTPQSLQEDMRIQQQQRQA
jgi:hypothetical protein